MVSLNRDALTEKILEGARISTDDALELYRSPLEELAALANARRDLAKAKSYGGDRYNSSASSVEIRAPSRIFSASASRLSETMPGEP